MPSDMASTEIAIADLTTETGTISFLQQAYPQHKCLSAERLDGGFSAYSYRVNFEPPLDGKYKTAILKHVKDHAARAFHVPLSADRLKYESLFISTVRSSNRSPLGALVQLPTLISYDPVANVLLLVDAGSHPTLKAWLTGSRSLSATSSIGSLLAHFIADLHSLPNPAANPLNANVAGRQLSADVYYGQGLLEGAARFNFNAETAPETIKILTEVGRRYHAEVMQSNKVLTMGDFFTGNVLIDDAKHPFSDSEAAARIDGSSTGISDAPVCWVLDFELAKPGTAEFDVGQMAAEMYGLVRFRDKERGWALLDAFLATYKGRRGGEIDPVKVAVRVGAHMVRFGPIGWAAEAGGENGEVKDYVADGIDLIAAAWKGQDEVLRRSMIRSLY